jgi:hypothetical protein
MGLVGILLSALRTSIQCLSFFVCAHCYLDFVYGVRLFCG